MEMFYSLLPRQDPYDSVWFQLCPYKTHFILSFNTSSCHQIHIPSETITYYYFYSIKKIIILFL